MLFKKKRRIYEFETFDVSCLATAIEECAAEKEDAKYSNDDLYTVECSGKNVVITRKIEDSDLDTYEDYYEDWCQDQKRRLKNGELDLYL